ncbi:MAG: autorepressor SdpR family transcription factor [Lewinella sp.]
MNELFKALNDPTRRSILELLRQGELTAGEIADHFVISKPSISHHLDILKRAELVRAERDGQFVRYALNSTVMEDMIAWLLTFKTSDDA